MRNRLKIHAYLVQGYMLCTAIAWALLIPAHDISMTLFSVGASSSYIALGVFCAATTNQVVGICSFLWAILFPIALIISFVFWKKKRNKILYAFIGLDAIIVILWTLYAFLQQNTYGMKVFLPDAVISVCYFVCVCMTLCNACSRKTGYGSVC